MIKIAKSSYISLIILAGLSLGCDTSFHGELKLKGGTRQKIQYDADLTMAIRFLASRTDTPQYSIIVDGYPYNRLLLKASVARTDYSGDAPVTTIIPMQINVGTQVPITIAIGGNTLSYTATIATVSNLPAGTYLIDAPGIVQDVQDSLLANPGATIEFYIPGTSTGGTKLLPSAGSVYTDGVIGSTNIDMSVSSTDALSWADLQTAPLTHPGPVQIQ